MSVKKKLIRYVINSGFAYRLARMFTSWKTEDFMKEAILYNLRQTEQAFIDDRPTIWCSTFVPSELVYALGGVPFMPEVAAGFSARVDMAGEAINLAEADWLNNDLCSIHRCGTGLMKQGFLPEPDYVIASCHLCDGAKRYLQHISYEYDVPFYFLPTPYYREEAPWLAERIKEIARKIKGRDPDFTSAFAKSNQAYKYHKQVNELRKKDPVTLAGEHSMNLVPLEFMSFGSQGGVKFYRNLLETLEKRLQDNEPVLEGQKHRLLWLHLKPYYSQRMFSTLREKGAVVAFEEYSQLYWDPLDPSQPYLSLARKMIGHFGWGLLAEQGRTIEKMVAEYNIDGVIGFSHWGCRQSNGRMDKIKMHLKKKGIPFLNIDGDLVDATNYQEGQLLTRLEAFIELIDMQKGSLV
ncbi:MAG: 2-hydroxyacyl-CoA dehydratase subunit D [Halanaerobiales bacterium]